MTGCHAAWSSSSANRTEVVAQPTGENLSTASVMMPSMPMASSHCAGAGHGLSRPGRLAALTTKASGSPARPLARRSPPQ